ncbi:MAG: DedA family protein [Candidatus Diapherotrites archaeon]|nr:DedA family protein [Candidatus Diapherotrites archaeon]
MVFVELIAEHVTALISAAGYPGIFLLMALESMITPLPSELVMPFAGFLVSNGAMDFWLVAFVGALGSLFGSLISYYAGMKLGRPVILRFGKYVFLNEHHLKWTEQWFQKHGAKTIFIGRLLPAVRHIISIPAGLGKMNLAEFSAYTFAGAFVWCAFLTFLGMQLKENWQVILQFTTAIDAIVVIAILAAAAFFVFSHMKRKNRAK